MPRKLTKDPPLHSPLRLRREEVGLSLRGLFHRSKLPLRRCWELEHGQSPIKLHEVYALAIALNTSVDEIRQLHAAIRPSAEAAHHEPR